jgi:hypothetical protein
MSQLGKPQQILEVSEAIEERGRQPNVFTGASGRKYHDVSPAWRLGGDRTGQRRG